MLMNAKKPKQHSSISPASAVSIGLSNELDTESQPQKELGQEMITRIPHPEIEAAQQLLARIAVRIVTRRRTDEK
jgi:hypothetical protein